MIRSLCFSLILFLIPLLSSAQQSDQLLFDQANSLLEEGSFPAAMQAYKVIEQTGQVSGGLFLNMGITAVQLDSMGLAKYYFLKATQFTTTREEASNALEYVSSQFSRQSATLPKLPWDKAVDFMKNGIGAFGVFMIGFCLVFLSVLLVLAKWFRVLSFGKINTFITTFIVSGILIVLLSFYVDYVDQRFSEAVIVMKETQVMQQPEASSDLISLAYEGYSIVIDHRKSNSSEGWYYIRLGNGQFGWIQPGAAKIL